MRRLRPSGLWRQSLRGARRKRARVPCRGCAGDRQAAELVWIDERGKFALLCHPCADAVQPEPPARVSWRMGYFAGLRAARNKKRNRCAYARSMGQKAGRGATAMPMTHSAPKGKPCRRRRAESRGAVRGGPADA